MPAQARENRIIAFNIIARIATLLRKTPQGKPLLDKVNYDIATLLTATTEDTPSHPILNELLQHREDVLAEKSRSTAHSQQPAKHRSPDPRAAHNPRTLAHPDSHPQQPRHARPPSQSPSPPRQRSRSRRPYPDPHNAPPEHHMSGALAADDPRATGPIQPHSADDDGFVTQSRQHRRRRRSRRYKRPSPPRFSVRKGLGAFVRETVAWEVDKVRHAQKKEERASRGGGSEQGSGTGENEDRASKDEGYEHGYAESGTESDRQRGRARHRRDAQSHSYRDERGRTRFVYEDSTPTRYTASTERHADASYDNIHVHPRRRKRRYHAHDPAHQPTRARGSAVHSIISSLSALRLPGVNAPPVTEAQRRDFYGLTRRGV
ncbi:hypothetical protein EJ05DRAFT_498470 [Pseudovirgaria hyperparasitica]|uniref:Uncharacterized protein n=1 Tax=Pseudovirgaria hyperparasitica TaxID=470096 RepID=A0A6A6WFX6_9PEZI|nr:uncharacterized protein EJ05DRAFT_498470 [Pseudovirgaria hyperparasitica]KAF2760507.1 hypothetical protein EJ05DRAFT_498470 [Pseudovirgaria hyperparasitica]